MDRHPFLFNAWESNGNLVQLSRSHIKSTNCVINLHGGTITSWKIWNIERLFVHEESRFDNIHPIRGGIQVVFPNFNMDRIDMPNNGFARVNKWEMVKEPYIVNNNIVAEISLKENVVMKGVNWKHPFILTCKVTLGPSTLNIDVGVYNPHQTEPLPFNLLLYANLSVSEIEKCEIEGLRGREYTDKINCQISTEQNESVKIKERFDRIYHNTKHDFLIKNMVSKSILKIGTRNFSELAIINPWKDVTTEYNKMICVAPGIISKIYELNPGCWFSDSLKLTLLNIQ